MSSPIHPSAGRVPLVLQRSAGRLRRIAAIFGVIGWCSFGLAQPVFAGGPPGCSTICIAVDGSGSIGSSNFDLIKSGLSGAIRDASVVPRDGSLFLAIVQFGTGSGAQVEAPLTFIDSDAAANDVANKVDAMIYGNGGTPMDAGINACATAILNGACPDKQIINIVTDGSPDSPAATIAARQNAVNMGVDKVNAEAVQAPEAAFMFLRDELVWPQPGYEAPPFQGANGFVVKAASFSDFANAIRAKLGQLTGSTPGEGCQIFTSTDVPKTIPDLGMASSTVNVTAVGSPSSISIVDLRGSHSFMEDLEIHLTSPQNTDVVVFMQTCGDNPGYNFSLDSRASILTPCPPDDGLRHRPSNPLTVFNGQDPAGIWRLDIFDKRPADFGDLQGWGIEVCYPPPPTNPGCESYTSTGPSQPIEDFTTISSTINVTATGALTSVSIPNMTGTHTFMEDLDITLVSPLGTEVLVFDQACSDDQGFNFGLSDSTIGDSPCPPNDGQIHKPSNPLSAFAGEEASGLWTLRISDQRPADEGALDHWTIEVCFGDTQCFTVNSTDVPQTIPDLGSARSELDAPFIDVTDPNDIFYRVRAQGSHSFFEDLRFTLTSAQGTEVLLTDQKCSNYSGPFNITWDDASPNGAPCPPNPNSSRPEQSFAGTINGELPGGTWFLDVDDIRGVDDGVLSGWTLDICVGGDSTPTPTPTPDCVPGGGEQYLTGNSTGGPASGSITLPPGLVFSPNVCTPTFGTCTINGQTATWSATLAPFETGGFEITYEVAPGVPDRTQLCTTGFIRNPAGFELPAGSCIIGCAGATPTPTHTPPPTFTRTPTRTPTHQPTFTPTRTHTFPPTHTPSLTPTGTRPPTFTPTHTHSPTPTFTRTPTSSPTHTHSPTVTPTHTRPPKPTFTPTWTATVTHTDTPTPTEFATATSTETRTETPTFSPSQTPTGTQQATFTPTRTGTSTHTPTNTSAATFTPSATPTDTRRSKPTFTPTDTFTVTETPTATPTGPTATPTETPTGPTNTPTPSSTPTATGPTATPTFGATFTPTSAGGIGDPCMGQPDCMNGFCLDDVCCETSSCPTGQRCDTAGMEGMCAPPGLGDPCPDTGTCANGFCVDGVCCASASCPLGQRCDTITMPGSCAPPGIGDPCTGPGICTQGFCVDGFCCTTGSCPAGQRCDIPGMEGTCTGPGIGDPCTGPGQCSEGTCVDDTCCETASCPAEERCDIFGMEGSCAPPASGGQPCEDNLDCQDGLACRFSTLRLQNLCTPDGGVCSCVGDCNCDGSVTVDEIITMVSVALGALDEVACLMGDANRDGVITVDEIITAVNNALNGCPQPPPTPTPTLTPSPTPT